MSDTLKSSELHLLQAELEGSLVSDIDFQRFVCGPLKLREETYSNLIHQQLGSLSNRRCLLGAVSAAKVETQMYGPLIELVRWIQTQLGLLLGLRSSTNLSFCSTWSRALEGSDTSRKPDITSVMGCPPITCPEWKEVLVVWEVKHNASRVHPMPASCEVAPMRLFHVAPTPRLFVSDPGGLVPVSKKQVAPMESLPVSPRKKVCFWRYFGATSTNAIADHKSKSNSTSQEVDAADAGTTPYNDATRKRETPLEQLLSYCLEAIRLGQDFLNSVKQFESREFRVLVLSPVCELITAIDELPLLKMCFIKRVKGMLTMNQVAF